MVLVLVVSAVLSVAGDPGTFPPVLPAVVPLIAAAFFPARITALVATIAVVEVSLIAHYSEGFSGVALGSRVLMTLGSGVLAVVLAEMRCRHEAEISRARTDLAEAELLQAVVDTAADPIYAKDVHGRYLVANNAAARTLGVDEGAQLVGRRDRDLVSPQRADRIEADDARTLASHEPLEFEEVLEGPDRRILLTHKTALRGPDGIIGLSGIAKDVTVKRRAQRELERSERRFRSLVEASTAIVWRTGPAGGFSEPQERWRRYTGQSWADQAGMGWLRAVHPHDRDRIGEAWRESVLAGGFHESLCRLWHQASGTHRHVVVRAVPVTDGDDGVITEWLGACEDVHDQHVAEERLRRIAEARDLVAEVASRVAMAAGRQQVARDALDVLQARLAPHVGAVTLVGGGEITSSEIFSVSGADATFDFAGLAGLDLPPDHVIATGEPLEYADVEELVSQFPDAKEVAGTLGLNGATFVVPLDTGARVMGALSVTFFHEVAGDQLDLVRFALAELDTVLAHSLLQAEFHEREAEIASTFQRSMLELAVEADPRLALSVHYQAGAEQMEAGGDWYDVVPLDDGRIALMVGDVVGRSLEAAAAMGRLRGACRGLLLATGDPAAVLTHLDTVAATIEGARFSTCCCVVVDPGAQTATYSAAGHPPALVLRDDDEPEYLWGAQGPPLAVPVANRPVATTAFPTGTRLFLYTDGLVERRDELIDMGLDRLVRAAVAGRDRGVAMECDRIASALFDDFSQSDDVAIVCAELVSHAADELVRHLPPDDRRLRRVRRDALVWLEGHGFTGTRADEVVLAMGEVLANAIEHAGPTAEGISLRLSVPERRTVEVVVVDDGRWKDHVADPTRGRGLTIAERLADEFHLEPTSSGTRVQMRFGR
jgi:PAS domain S-box-containing protein